MGHGEPCSLNSGLGSFPGGGGRSQSSGPCREGVPGTLFPSPTSQLCISLEFQPWTAGARWKLFWGPVVGRTSGPSDAAVPVSLRCVQRSAPSAAPSPLHSPPLAPCHPQPSCSRLFLTGNLSDRHLQWNLSSLRSAVFLSPLCKRVTM